MDQDAFRTLLASGASSQSRPSVTINDWKGKNKKKEADASSSTPTFKPRNHKKPVETYRDRATERRGGVNDFTEVEKVLEDFERVNADTDADMIEEQRKMLGGDEKHTVLVKGLDFALLEQQKAKLYESQDASDEMALEQVFQELSAPKKRTREELVASLKKSREEIPVDKPLEIAKQQGKFRPIGAPTDIKPKKRKVKADEKDGGKKKKKRKLDDASKDVQETSNAKDMTIEEANHLEEGTTPRPKPRPRTKSPEIDPDADIFADADDYQGLPSGSDSDSDGQESRPRPAVKPSIREPVADSTARMDWFGETKEEEPTRPPAGSRQAPGQDEAAEMEEGEAEEEKERPVMRLPTLASSAVPSIREILAMDEAAEKEEKRKAKKEKRNKKKNPTEETKINREVKELEQYVAKKPK